MWLALRSILLVLGGHALRGTLYGRCFTNAFSFQCSHCRLWGAVPHGLLDLHQWLSSNTVGPVVNPLLAYFMQQRHGVCWCGKHTPKRQTPYGTWSFRHCWFLKSLKGIEDFAFKVYRPRQRPLLLINVYLHANDLSQAKHLLLSIFEWVAELGEEALILGDFNMERHVWPISTALATGKWYSCDEQVCGDQLGTGTHRNSNNKYTGRVIDFGLATPRVLITDRTQNVGVADHDAVVYDIAVLDRPSAVWRLPAGEPLLEAPIPEDMWENAWQQVDNDFHKCLTEGEIQQAWVILSNCAERLMHPKGKASRAERSGPQQMASPPSSKAPTFQTLLERKLRRFARRVQEFQRSFLPELARKFAQRCKTIAPFSCRICLRRQISGSGCRTPCWQRSRRSF